MLITMGNVLTRNANLAENTDSHRFGYRANGKPKPENSVHVSMIVVAAGGWTLPPPLAEIN